MYNRILNSSLITIIFIPYNFLSLTDGIRKNLDEGNLVCGIFVDLNKAFDTVEHNILLSKHEHYSVHGLANEWFKFYSQTENNMSPLIAMILILLM